MTRSKGVVEVQKYSRRSVEDSNSEDDVLYNSRVRLSGLTAFCTPATPATPILLLSAMV